MDWQDKYFDNLESLLKEIRDELRQSESRTSNCIRDAMHKVYIQSDQRHREYLSLNERVNQLVASIEAKQEEQNKWIHRTAVAVILGVASIVSTGVFGLLKFIDTVPHP